MWRILQVLLEMWNLKNTFNKKLFDSDLGDIYWLESINADPISKMTLINEMAGNMIEDAADSRSAVQWNCLWKDN